MDLVVRMNQSKSKMAAVLRRKQSDSTGARPKGVRFSQEIEYFPPYCGERGEEAAADELQRDWERQMQRAGLDDNRAWIRHLLETHKKFCNNASCVSEGRVVVIMLTDKTLKCYCVIHFCIVLIVLHLTGADLIKSDGVTLGKDC